MLPDPIPASESPQDGLVERRRVLRWSGGAVGLAALGAVPAAEAPQESAQERESARWLEPLAWERFLRDLRGASDELVASKAPREDAYLFLLASWMLRLEKIPEAEMKPLRILEGLKLGRLRHHGALSVSRFAIAPGVEIPLHDHRGHAAAFVVLEGEVALRNFEAEGKRPVAPGGTVTLRERPRQAVGAGRVSTLGRVRDNFHVVTAGKKGAVGLEVFTRIRREGGSAFYDLDEKPVDAHERRFSATRR